MAQTNENVYIVRGELCDLHRVSNQPTLTWHATTLRSANRIGQFLADISPKE